MAHLFKPDGTIEKVTPQNGKKFTLEEMQKLVGGYVEPCDAVDGRRMVTDEDGKLKGKPLNWRATKLYIYGAHAQIVGDVLVGSKKEFGI